MIEKDRRELRRCTFCIVHLQGDEIAFPVRPFAFGQLFVPTEAPVVRFCANHQNKLGPVESVEHPSRPTFLLVSRQRIGRSGRLRHPCGGAQLALGRAARALESRGCN